MSEATHWRSYAKSTVAKHLDDPDHIPGAIRWNREGTRALMRFRGAPSAKSHMTPSEARAEVAKAKWQRPDQ